MKAFTFVSMAVFVLSLCVPASAQELLQNGDFETLAMSGDPPMPTRDAFDNAFPINWFRATAPDPNRPDVPLTELIAPENGDPADDSNGTGQRSVAMNSASINAHSDWRSAAFVTMPEEELFWSFDFKFLSYAYTPGLNLPEGFRIELRSFTEGTEGGSTSGTFVGEQTVYVYVHGYGNDTDGDGIGDSGGWATGGAAPHGEGSVTVGNFNDGQWHRLSSDIFGDQNMTDENNLWRIPVDGNFSDVRVSINAFNTVFTDQLQLRVDNISVVRPGAPLPGDYNANGEVDAADYVLWRNSGPLQNEVATIGDVTPEDYTEWRSRFGHASAASAGLSAVGSVPEPNCLALCFVFSLLIPFCRAHPQPERAGRGALFVRLPTLRRRYSRDL